jgi:hypothetical protein
MIISEYGDLVMKEFVRYGARTWTSMEDPEKIAYSLMADVDKVRYERDKLSF